MTVALVRFARGPLPPDPAALSFQLEAGGLLARLPAYKSQSPHGQKSKTSEEE